MPGVTGTALTVALEPTDGVGDTDGVDTDEVGTRWVMSLDVRERYSPEEGGERVMGVSGSISDEEELDGDECGDDDGGEYDIGDEIGEGDSLGTSGSVSNNSVSNGSDSNGSDSIKLKSSEWGDDRNDILELKELGERRRRGGGVSGMAMICGLALPVTVGGLEG
jgi:hypothetical protein